MKSLRLRNKKGQIALPFVLLVGGIIVEIVLAGSFISFFVNATSLGERLSVRASSVANTGLYDAIMKISSNKEFGGPGGTAYEVSVGDDTATVSVSRSERGNLYIYSVESVATARNRKKKVVAKVVANKITGEISLQSVGEEAVE